MTFRNYSNGGNDNNNQFQDNIGCSAFTVCNLKSPFGRDITPTKIMSFLFFAAALKIQQQNAYRGNTDTSDNLPQQGSSALNEVPL